MIKETLIYMGIAFAGAFVLIMLSKFIMPLFMKRPADYYCAGEEESELFFTDPVLEAEKAEAAAAAERERIANLQKPTMRMKKAELIELAGEYRVELPSKITKAQIIELIEEKRS